MTPVFARLVVVVLSVCALPALLVTIAWVCLSIGLPVGVLLSPGCATAEHPFEVGPWVLALVVGSVVWGVNLLVLYHSDALAVRVAMAFASLLRKAGW